MKILYPAKKPTTGMVYTGNHVMQNRPQLV